MQSIANFLTHQGLHALVVSSCITGVYLGLHQFFGHGFIAYAEHELIHAFVFASVVALGLALSRTGR